MNLLSWGDCKFLLLFFPSIDSPKVVSPNPPSLLATIKKEKEKADAEAGKLGDNGGGCGSDKSGGGSDRNNGKKRQGDRSDDSERSISKSG